MVQDSRFISVNDGFISILNSCILGIPVQLRRVTKVHICDLLVVDHAYEENKTISLESDVFVGCHNAEQENFVRQKLHKIGADNTGGLSYELILVLNRPYMTTNNIDVADGLSNGPVGKLCYVGER
ncbi:uncharacterized protein TNIN_228161 [Trichonephila inaurata madagascariensis]|uniref:Uncharacterized protein n=1 Tax=Trichonephila inaurata madagascariensis TaxID=2747483 RepID=A0A8X6JMH4_9ARAC|nr:uncharacterized protein TNIN_228161 [Trichonephila inaurata madagascariensis]